jgi:hypothetical protein
MSNYSEGHLNFMIQIPANVAFKIGITDVWTNQHYVDFPANTTAFGLVRNGEWGQASIPISELRGELIDLRMLMYPFVILEINGASCQFAIDDIYWDGAPTSIEAPDLSTLPTEFSLEQNYPNPFNPATTLRFGIPENSDVRLTIYDVQGRVVHSITEHNRSPGRHAYTWSGTNQSGGPVETGIYFAKVEAGIHSSVIKMIYLK